MAAMVENIAGDDREPTPAAVAKEDAGVGPLPLVTVPVVVLFQPLLVPEAASVHGTLLMGSPF